MIDAGILADRLGVRFGLELSSDSSAGSSELSLRVEGIDPPNGFRIAGALGWRSIEASFVPDPFASGLMKTLCNENLQRRSEVSALAAAFIACGTKCLFRIDEKTVDASALPSGPWTRFELTCSRLTDKSDGQRDTEEVFGTCLALLLSLLPVEDEGLESASLSQGLPEGALTRVAVNRYERRPANRAAAIAVHGSICHACGFDFSDHYGKIGEGFIEIHHITPVSKLGENYVVDPVKDLVPLCSNCHQMVHRHDPPISVEDLRTEVIGRRRLMISK